MYKFIQQYAGKMEQAQIYPTISLVIFFLFFVVLIWYVKKMDKENLSVLSNIPLDEQTEPAINIE